MIVVVSLPRDHDPLGPLRREHERGVRHAAAEIGGRRVPVESERGNRRLMRAVDWSEPADERGQFAACRFARRRGIHPGRSQIHVH